MDIPRWDLPQVGTSLDFDTGPEGPELEGELKGIQQVYALSTPKEKTPTAALRAAKRGRKPIANGICQLNGLLFF